MKVFRVRQSIDGLIEGFDDCKGVRDGLQVVYVTVKGIEKSGLPFCDQLFGCFRIWPTFKSNAKVGTTRPEVTPFQTFHRIFY